MVVGKDNNIGRVDIKNGDYSLVGIGTSKEKRQKSIYYRYCN